MFYDHLLFQREKEEEREDKVGPGDEPPSKSCEQKARRVLRLDIFTDVHMQPNTSTR